MNKKILLICLLGILLPATTFAAPKKPTDAELSAFRDRIAKCWKVPGGELDRNFDASIEVEINPQGKIKTMKVVEKSQPSQPLMVGAIKQAITKCSPYVNAPDYKFIVYFQVLKEL